MSVSTITGIKESSRAFKSPAFLLLNYVTRRTSDRILIRVRFCPKHLLSVQYNVSVLNIVVDDKTHGRFLLFGMSVPEPAAGNILILPQRVAVS